MYYIMEYTNGTKDIIIIDEDTLEARMVDAKTVLDLMLDNQIRSCTNENHIVFDNVTIEEIRACDVVRVSDYYFISDIRIHNTEVIINSGIGADWRKRNFTKEVNGVILVRNGSELCIWHKGMYCKFEDVLYISGIILKYGDVLVFYTNSFLEMEGTCMLKEKCIKCNKLQFKRALVLI